MSVFTVDLANRPGELARLCEAMAGRGINLVLSAIAREDGGTVAFIADDEAGAQEVLDGAGLQYAMRPALTIRMENQPGTGAATFRKLASAGVNADLLLPVRVSDALFFAVICVDDQDKARQALGAQVIPPGPRPVALAAVSPGEPGRSPPMPRSQRHRSYPGPDDETGCRPGLWCSDPYARIAVAAGALVAGMGLGGGRSGLAGEEEPPTVRRQRRLGQVTGCARRAGQAWVGAVPALRRALGDAWRNCWRRDPCAGSAGCH